MPPVRDTYCSYCGASFAGATGYPRTCAGCNTQIWANPIPVSVVLVPVEAAGRTGLLVVRRAIPPQIGKLALVGGFLEEHESWQVGGAREVREEAGVEVDPATLEPLWFASSEPRPNRLLLFSVARPLAASALPPFTAKPRGLRARAGVRPRRPRGRARVPAPRRGSSPVLRRSGDHRAPRLRARLNRRPGAKRSRQPGGAPVDTTRMHTSLTGRTTRAHSPLGVWWMTRALSLLVLLVAGFAGCTKTNTEVCCTTAADCAAVGLPAETRCSDGFTCMAHECVAAACSSDPDCPAEAPVCTEGRCVACDASHGCTQHAPVCNVITETCGGCVGDADCAAFADAPRCDTSAGACVQCVAGGDCAAGEACVENTCRACTHDAECETGACDDEGRCVAESEILVIAPSGGTDAGSCTRSAPCRSLSYAISVATQRRHIVMLPGEYREAVSTSASNVWIHGAGARLSPRVTNAPLFEVRGGLKLSSVEITGTTSAPSLKVLGTLELRSVHIHDAPGLEIGPMQLSALVGRDVRFENLSGRAAILVDIGSTLELDRAEIIGGQVGIEGLSSELGASGTLTLSNLLIAGTTRHAITCRACMGSLRFATIADAGAASSAAPCAVSVGTSFAVTSSIIWQPGCAGVPQAAIGPALFTTTIVGPVPVPGTLNVDPLFVDASAGDYHLQPDSPAIDVADGGPAVDLDGDPRPQGARFDLGADEARP